jgi:hypothetical protein
MSGTRAVPRSVVIGVAACALAVSGLAVSCTGKTDAATGITTTSATLSTPMPTPSSKAPRTSTTPTPTPTPTRQKIPRVFDRKNFEAAGSDVNPWVPMTAGVQVIRKGTVYIGGRTVPHVTVTTITNVRKKIDGVKAVLVLDQDIDGGQVSEQAVDYLAEDVGGNVWYVGSYTEVYEGGQFLNAEDAWLAGVNGAVAGLWFPGDPQPGSRPFLQVQVPGFEQSTAQVVQAGKRKCVPFDCFKDVVVLQEAGSENKYWAPEVGQILTEPLSGVAQEIEQLINVKELSRSGLAELSSEALKLDRHAAQTVPSVFAASNPAIRAH